MAHTGTKFFYHSTIRGKFRPVSYTHLDVYKRQELNNIRWAISGVGLLDNYDPAAEGYARFQKNGKVYDYSDVLRRTNHTAIGVKGGQVYGLYLANMTGAEVNAYCKKQGLQYAIMLDGGHIAAVNCSLGQKNASQKPVSYTHLEQLEADVAAAGIEEKKGTITAEIDRIEGELSELDERAKKTKSNPAEKRKERGESDMTTNKYQTRELLRTGEYYERAEVKEFYEKLKNVRAVTGGELTIPQVIMNRIFDIMGDYTTLYPLVDKIRVSGTTRILIDTDTTAAVSYTHLDVYKRQVPAGVLMVWSFMQTDWWEGGEKDGR